ncbi:MAG: DUF58 domain-containing protein [Spirochaetes bacterium]|nr:DUF58 domain-containing protein [Spirochaetota bacterium]
MIRINFRAAILYLISLSLLYLAAMSFAGAVAVVYYALLLFLLISLVTFISNSLSLRFIEIFSNEHPLRGETINYKLSLSNEFFLPIAEFCIVFRETVGTGENFEKKINCFIGGKKYFEKKYSVISEHRGVYELGIERAEVRDIAGILAYSPKIFFRTFYVRPRIFNPEKTDFAENLKDSNGGSFHGGMEIDDQFSSIDEYREGMDAKRIFWKKYFSTGNMYVKLFQGSSRKSIEVHADMRKSDVNHTRTNEDLILESLLSVSAHLMKCGTSFSVFAEGEKIFGDNSGLRQFDKFYESTVFIPFDGQISPYARILSDSGAGIIKDTIVISSGNDYLCADIPSPEKILILYVSSHPSPEDERYFSVLESKGIRVKLISAFEDISKVFQ